MVSELQQSKSVDTFATQMLLIQVQRNIFCIDLQNIERVLLLVELQTIPSGPDYLVGLMNVAGKSIPVVDLGIRLGLDQQQPYRLDTPIIICKLGDRLLAFIINDIIGIQVVHAHDLQSQIMFQSGELPYTASLALSHGQALVLDLPKLFEIDFDCGRILREKGDAS